MLYWSSPLVAAEYVHMPLGQLLSLSGLIDVYEVTARCVLLAPLTDLRATYVTKLDSASHLFISVRHCTSPANDVRENVAMTTLTTTSDTIFVRLDHELSYIG